MPESTLCSDVQVSSGGGGCRSRGLTIISIPFSPSLAEFLKVACTKVRSGDDATQMCKAVALHFVALG